MPTRSKKKANAEIFNLLDEFCSIRDEPLRNAGAPRWISTTTSGQDFLVRAELTQHLTFSTSVKTARFDMSNRTYFVTSGLDTSDSPAGLVLEDLDGSVLTAFLAELRPSPSVPPFAIRNIVEVADKNSTQSYNGHDPLEMCHLFPKIQVFSTSKLEAEETLKVFFLICLADRRCIEQWIDQSLASALAEITELSPTSIPYEVLCRAVLDLDPAALFLALYRCLEALYAHAHTHSFMTTVGIEKNWVEMAETLESTLGWYPREEPSLEALLEGAHSEDLRSVASALQEPISNGAKEAQFVGKRIYRLRNALVHYRPFHRKVSTSTVDWNPLCKAMSCLVQHAHKKCSV